MGDGDDPHAKDTPEHSARRAKIRGEILSTERNYVRGLDVLGHVYLASIKKIESDHGTYGADTEDVKALTNNIPTLIAINHQFLEEMEAHNENEMPGVFIKFSQVFKAYSQYLDGYERTLSVMAKLNKHKKFHVLMADVDAKCMQEQGALPLNAYLIMPVQRIPRYVLLLKELLENSSQGHPQYKDMETAYKKLQEIAHEVNEAKRKLEEMQVLRDLADRVQHAPSHWELIKPYRSLIKQQTCIVTMESHNGRKSSMKHSNRIIYLFTDLILLLKEDSAKKSLHYKSEIPVSAVSVEIQDTGTTITLQTAKAYIAVQFDTDQITAAWLAAIQHQKEAMRKQRMVKKTLRTNSMRKGTGLSSLIGDSLAGLKERRSGTLNAADMEAVHALQEASLGDDHASQDAQHEDHHDHEHEQEHHANHSDHEQ